MDRSITRRALLATAPAALASGTLLGMPSAAAADDKKTPLWPGFPRLEAKLVSEVVGKAHFDEARVKELVTAHPQLVNAWWDWGFGDWESPLGAASHVGHRGIAEFLLEHGARIDIFAAAMLGYTAVVKAFVAAQPGVQRTLGPHGITLLAHAKVGGKQAADTVAYLVELGDADGGHKLTDLPENRKQEFLGEYASQETDVRLECKLNKAGKLTVNFQHGKAETVSRILLYIGNDEFHTPGVTGVRFRFAIKDGKAASVALLRGSDTILTAKRAVG